VSYNAVLSNGTSRVLSARTCARDEHIDLEENHFMIVDPGANELSDAVTRKLSKIASRPVVRLSLNEVMEGSIAPGATVFCLFESHRSVLSTSTDDEMLRIKMTTNNACNIIWVTNGNPLESP